MPDFIKSLEHDQLGKREGWRSGSPRKSLPLSGGAGWQYWGQGAGKEKGDVSSAQGEAIPREP